MAVTKRKGKTISSETGKESSSSSSSADAKRKRPKPRIVAAHGEVIESRWWDVPCAKTRSAPITGWVPGRDYDVGPK
eukprot:gene11351-26749_t